MVFEEPLGKLSNGKIRLTTLNPPVSLSLKKYLFIYFVLGLHRCVGFSRLVPRGGHSLVTGHKFLIAAASLVAKHGLL